MVRRRNNNNQPRAKQQTSRRSQPAPLPQRQPRARRRNMGTATVGQQSIGSALTTTSVRSPTNAIRISGSDTIALIGNIQTVGAASGDEVANIRVTPSISPRLAQHAVCYNEIKYHSLTAKINGQASSLTVGSVILAFCSDPADAVFGEPVAWARSQKCNASGKYWETIRVNVPHSQMHGPNDGFFKNNVGLSEAPRTYSPGFFSLIVISPANQETPMEIQLEWDVTLRNPTFNPLVDEGPVVVTALEAFGLKGNATPDTAFDPALQAFVGTTERPLTKDDFSPPLDPEVRYRIPDGQITITGNTGSSGAPQAVMATHLGANLADDAVILYRYLVSNGTFQGVNSSIITAQPLPSAAPSFRKLSDWVADPATLATSAQLGFRQLSLLPLPSRQRRSLRSQ